MIRCTGVTKSYDLESRRVEALRGVDFEIAEPGFYAVMGRSGSGKSTLLHLLAALDRPDAGEIHIAGRPIHALNERDATEFRGREIGIVFQQFNLISTLNARENVELPGDLRGDDPGQLRARSGELLDRLGLGDRMEHRPQALSGGEQQRVAIARALLFNPPVVFADEPTGNLDSASSEKLWSLLREIAEQEEMTVLMVTHEPSAAAHCRHVIVLADGRVTGSFDVENGDEVGVAARYSQLTRQA
ncbi:MAG TPA: ABC transporter ATP-binding protein [Phycisphaerales bacterium]|nr:ABC transporter ATP-binding protein [Phycisphaerales bacterium]